MKIDQKQLDQFYRHGRTLPEGRYSIGNNLYLQVTSPTAASWIYMGAIGGKRREIGLGSFLGTGRTERLTKRQAEVEAQKITDTIRDGIDPRPAKVKAAIPTFAKMLDAYLEVKGPGMEPKTVTQWRQQLGLHCAAILKTPVNQITIDMVIAAMRPIWKRSLGNTQRLRIEAVLDYACFKLAKVGITLFPAGHNPARLEAIEHELDKPRLKGQDASGKKSTYAALHFDEVPAFVARLRAFNNMPAKVLLFVILTGLRVNEAAEAKWSEIDWEKAELDVPAERMKGGVHHIVPLSAQAIELLRDLPRIGEYIFPAAKDATKPTDSKLLNELITKRMGYKGRTTVHGFRSTLRDWGGEQSRDSLPMYASQDLEYCLAHKLPDATEASYRRMTALDRRRLIMQHWADFACGTTTNVVQLPAREVA